MWTVNKMLKVCGHRILVKQESLEDTDPVYKRAKEAGIALSEHRDTQLERRQVDKGVVVQVGANSWKSFDDGHAWCAEGDSVIWVRHGGYIVKDPETNIEYVVLNDEDILCVLKDKEA